MNVKPQTELPEGTPITVVPAATRGRKPTLCPFTRDELHKLAGAKVPQDVAQALTEKLAAAILREFNADPEKVAKGVLPNFGYNVSAKVDTEIDGRPVRLQVGCNLVIVGSKDSR